MSGSATTAIVTSSNNMNVPRHTAVSGPQVRMSSTPSGCVC